MQPAPEPSVEPSPGPPLKRKIAAIVAADVAGYSRLVALDEERTLRAFAAAREIFDGRVHRAGGRIFNTAGDSVMCEFDSAVEAVRAAIDIQDAIAGAGAGTDPARRIAFRIGITIGDVVERGQDLLGDGVNIAARLESIAPPGGICISRSVHEAVAGKIPARFDDMGLRPVKNLPQPLHAFMFHRGSDALRPGEPISVEPRRERPAGTAAGADRPARGLAPFAAAGVLLIVAAGAALPGLPFAKRAIESWTAPAPRSETAKPATPAVTPVEVVTAPAKPTQTARGQASTGPTQNGQAATGQPSPGQAPGSLGQKATPRIAERGPEKPITVDEKAGPPAPARPADPAAAFASLSAEGIVSDPKTVPELYHNARILEAKGDRQAALKAYAAAAPEAGQSIDLLMRYAALLRATSGTEAARKAVSDLARGAPGTATALIAATQAEPSDRRGRLEAIASENPDYLPAAYFLAEALTEKRQGGPTLTDRRLAFAALDRFLESAETGALAPLFVDRSFLDGWLDAARARRGEIESYFASTPVRPTATFARTEAGWTARVTLPEPATQVSVRLGESGDLIPAASGSRAVTSAEVALPAPSGRTTLYVGYRDTSGRDAGPFPLPFDPAGALVSSSRDTLERFPESWVAFRPDLPDLVSYAQLVANRCAIRRAMIGFGDEPPRQALPLPACETGIATAADSRAVLALPAGIEAVQVQLAYADGSESPVRTFRRP